VERFFVKGTSWGMQVKLAQLEYCGLVVFLLDAFSHLYKRVSPSVGRSVRRSVGRSVTHKLNFEKWAEFEQNSMRNKKVCHLEDDSKTSTRAVSQNASVVRTLFDLFFLSVRLLFCRVSWFHQKMPLGDRSTNFGSHLLPMLQLCTTTVEKRS